MKQKIFGILVFLTLGASALAACGDSVGPVEPTGDSGTTPGVDGSKPDPRPGADSASPGVDANLPDARYDGGGCPTKMKEIPAGTYMMGSTATVDERPIHAVSMAVFCMDETEVTVDAYAACVGAGKCTPAATDPQCNAAEVGRANHPINCVDWNQSGAYCAFVGKRLPTEEEWEYAARGTDGRTYPWGSDAPAAQLCWSGVGNDVGQGNRRSTCVAGSYPAGKSPFGILDMAGNVQEWTASGYSADYDQARGAMPVFRGGSWSNSSPLLMRAASRVREAPTERNNSLGFRCAL